MAKLLVCMDRSKPSLCLEIHERRLIIPGGKFEDKVGLGEPTENPYDGLFVMHFALIP